jgi:hypothetical protein
MPGMRKTPEAREAVPSHVREAEQHQAELIRAMTPFRRLEIAREMYDTAWKIKSAGLQAQHPDWSPGEVAAAVRRIFLTGYAGA